MEIAIVGAGGHGRVAWECLELSGVDMGIAAFFDDRYAETGCVEGATVYGPVSSLCTDPRFEKTFVAIGANVARRRITRDLVSAGKRILTIIHPHNGISPRAHLECGTIAIAGVVVNRGARIGRGVILNTLCSVGHDCLVEDFAQVAPGVNLGGAAIIEQGVFLGIGAKVVPEARVGAWSIVGAGSVVLNDLPSGWFCFGSPARAIRRLRPEELPADIEIAELDQNP